MIPLMLLAKVMICLGISSSEYLADTSTKIKISAAIEVYGNNMVATPNPIMIIVSS